MLRTHPIASEVLPMPIPHVLFLPREALPAAPQALGRDQLLALAARALGRPLARTAAVSVFAGAGGALLLVEELAIPANSASLLPKTIPLS